MLKKTGIYDFFDLIITNEDVDSPKPNPDGYNKIISILNIEKNKTIIIEDSENGYIAAIASGCNVIRVKNQDFVNINLFKDIL
jgi:HAD superfamily hydrolase (TIGR01509 family)